MGIYEFNILDNEKKYDVTFNQGRFVDSITVENEIFVLYAVSMFWVEVVYNAKDNKIIGISSFIAGAILDKFSNLPNRF